MENIETRKDSPCERGDLELSFPDVETIVTTCTFETADPFSIQQKLMGIISHAAEEISRLSKAQAHIYLQYLARIAKGLRRNTELNRAFRFFYFGQFQTHVELLERRLEELWSEEQLLFVAGRKYFAPIMQLLYTEQVCQQQRISKLLKIDRSNLSRELQRLMYSGLVDSSKAGRFRYYRLTPQGQRYYNRYLTMKSQLEEQTNLLQDKSLLVKGPSLRNAVLSTLDSQDRLLLNSDREESLFAAMDTKSRSDAIYDYLRRST